MGESFGVLLVLLSAGGDRPIGNPPGRGVPGQFTARPQSFGKLRAKENGTAGSTSGGFSLRREQTHRPGADDLALPSSAWLICT